MSNILNKINKGSKCIHCKGGNFNYTKTETTTTNNSIIDGVFSQENVSRETLITVICADCNKELSETDIVNPCVHCGEDSEPGRSECTRCKELLENPAEMLKLLLEKQKPAKTKVPKETLNTIKELKDKVDSLEKELKEKTIKTNTEKIIYEDKLVIMKKRVDDGLREVKRAEDDAEFYKDEMRKFKKQRNELRQELENIKKEALENAAKKLEQVSSLEMPEVEEYIMPDEILNNEIIPDVIPGLITEDLQQPILNEENEVDKEKEKQEFMDNLVDDMPEYAKLQENDYLLESLNIEPTRTVDHLDAEFDVPNENVDLSIADINLFMQSLEEDFDGLA